jgi:hypothetical protein
MFIAPSSLGNLKPCRGEMSWWRSPTRGRVEKPISPLRGLGHTRAGAHYQHPAPTELLEEDRGITRRNARATLAGSGETACGISGNWFPSPAAACV